MPLQDITLFVISLLLCYISSRRDLVSASFKYVRIFFLNKKVDVVAI